MRNGRQLLGIAGLFLSSSGCVSPLTSTEISLAPPSPEAVRVIRALEARERGVEALRGLADVRISRGGGEQHLREVVLLQRPASLRLETLDLSGVTLLVFATDGVRLTVHSLVEREFLVGRASPENLATLLKIRGSPGHLVRLLAGLPPLSLSADDGAMLSPSSSAPEELGWVQSHSRVTQRVWVTPAGDSGISPLPAVRRGEVVEGRTPFLQFDFDDYRPLGESFFPFRILLRVPAEGVEIEVRYRFVEMNPLLSSAVFQLSPPSDQQSRIVDLDRLGSRPRRGEGSEE